MLMGTKSSVPFPCCSLMTSLFFADRPGEIGQGFLALETCILDYTWLETRAISKASPFDRFDFFFSTENNEGYDEKMLAHTSISIR